MAESFWWQCLMGVAVSDAWFFRLMVNGARNVRAANRDSIVGYGKSQFVFWQPVNTVWCQCLN